MLETFYRAKRFIFRCNLKKYRAGMIATFCGNREITLCNDKTLPVGFFLNELSNDYSISSSPSAIISVDENEYQTDIFEKGKYKHNDFLYCSRNGKITNDKKYKGNVIIGIVNYVSKERVGFITCFKRNIEK